MDFIFVIEKDVYGYMKEVSTPVMLHIFYYFYLLYFILIYNYAIHNKIKFISFIKICCIIIYEWSNVLHNIYNCCV